MTIYYKYNFMKLKIFKDILTEKVGNEKMYSQGRVYLLWSVIAYYIIIGFMAIKSLRPDFDIEVATLQTIIDALQWALGLFAGYVFGGKGLETIKTVLGKTTSTKQDSTPILPHEGE